MCSFCACPIGGGPQSCHFCWPIRDANRKCKHTSLLLNALCQDNQLVYSSQHWHYRCSWSVLTLSMLPKTFCSILSGCSQIHLSFLDPIAFCFCLKYLPKWMGFINLCGGKYLTLFWPCASKCGRSPFLEPSFSKIIHSTVLILF